MGSFRTWSLALIAGIFVMVVDPANAQGAILATYYLSTGTAGTTNGIASVSAADLDGDHITDYIYAGDLLGNVWRFDLTNASVSEIASTVPNVSDPNLSKLQEWVAWRDAQSR